MAIWCSWVHHSPHFSLSPKFLNISRKFSQRFPLQRVNSLNAESIMKTLMKLFLVSWFLGGMARGSTNLSQTVAVTKTDLSDRGGLARPDALAGRIAVAMASS
jgi:hypothetical protein